ncbi:DUF3054 domain-containing protein [Arthrobacter roseus]|uniref:DUF3054 domain-containing protein n=1 Tax=Arthrobacter roseus TaxID=136274 RepID=UPI00196419DC|nr:DUF3054 domain-containing protein [Arthrobacter roseus]MBM7848576.1 hypothetical protein [Arthrobacter roseus]
MVSNQHAEHSPKRWVLVLLTDLLLVLAFATMGRTQHESGLTAMGILSTAGPFLVACVAGWSITQNWNSPIRFWPNGVLVWLVTVIGGLTLRSLLEHPPALSFQIVTLLVLGALLLGHRLIRGSLGRLKNAADSKGK